MIAEGEARSKPRRPSLFRVGDEGEPQKTIPNYIEEKLIQLDYHTCSMKTIAKIELKANGSGKKRLLDTMETFNAACDEIAATCAGRSEEHESSMLVLWTHRQGEQEESERVPLCELRSLGECRR